MLAVESPRSTQAHDVTALLHRWSAGDPEAAHAALPHLYRELRRIAGACWRRERSDHTLQPTALVHEAFIALCDARGISYRDRGHFLRIAARAMRRILVDHSRRHGARKRGGDRCRVSLAAWDRGAHHAPEDMLALDQALNRLADHDPVDAQIVEMRYFAGLSRQEIAQGLACSTKTVSRRWRRARAWLLGELVGGPADGR